MADIKRISESRQRQIVDAIKKKAKSEPSLLAEHIGLPHGVQYRSPKQEQADWWTPDPDVIANQQAVMEEIANIAMTSVKEGEQPEDTLLRANIMYANKLYPARLPLMRSGARGMSAQAQLDFAEKMSSLGPPEESDEE